MPLLLYLSICVWGFSIFYIVFYVRRAVLIRVSCKSLVILLTSLLLYVKVTHFGFWCWGSLYVFCFRGVGGCQIELVLYWLLCNMFLMVFFSISFAF
jgi:hypothetical protein